MLPGKKKKRKRHSRQDIDALITEAFPVVRAATVELGLHGGKAGVDDAVVC
jgi:hypothetical protein